MIADCEQYDNKIVQLDIIINLKLDITIYKHESLIVDCRE